MKNQMAWAYPKKKSRTYTKDSSEMDTTWTEKEKTTKDHLELESDG